MENGAGEEDRTVWNGYFRFEINDLGFIRWNDRSLKYNFDTTYNFQGIVIKNFSELEDSIMQLFSDSVSESFDSAETTGCYTTILPTLFHFSFFQQKNNRVFFTVGTQFRLLANYNPYFYVKAGRNIFAKGGGNKCFLSATLGYGGYGKINFGIGLQAAFKAFHISIGSNNLEGFILPEYFGGNSAYIGIRKVF
ncbi:MAG: DUF5723 family protein [Bacteroidota bacterium]